LAYVAAVSRHGHHLSVKEFEVYVASPMRKSGQPWGLDALAMMKGIMLGPSESVLRWLGRPGWLGIDDRRGVILTPLGSTVLRALDEADVEPDVSVSIAPSDDTLAYPRVIGLIAERGPGPYLVDPYFRLESFPHVLHYTGVTRLLVGPQADCEELAVAIETLPKERLLEIRVSSSVHDRFVIPESGPVDHLGTSLNSLGTKLTVTAQIGPPAADAIRNEVERVWGTSRAVQEIATKTPGKESPDSEPAGAAGGPH
jgi:hypothetical protein